MMQQFYEKSNGKSNEKLYEKTNEKLYEKLYEKLCRYANDDIIPMHMPGHKRNFGFSKNCDEAYDIEFDKIFCMDITEISGFDNLHNPTGIIRELQQDIADIYGSRQSFMLVNGSTAGVLAAISAAACSNKNKIIISRNCHKSVYNALYLNCLDVVYVMPQFEKKLGIWGRIEPCDIEEKIKLSQDLCAIVITSPTYEGITSDINSISKIAHENNIPLIVDSAHGAHFKFSEAFPKTAIEAGADIVIESLHKTLPALTQTAVLHIGKNSLIDVKNIKRFLDIYQTTSPSYILMASISKCMEFVKSHRTEFDVFASRLRQFRKEVSQFNNIKIYPVDDLSKLIIYSPYLKGTQIYDILLKEYKIQLEMASISYAIAMTSVCDSEKNFEMLLNALEKINEKLENEKLKYEKNLNKSEFNFDFSKYKNIKTVMNFKEAFSSEKEKILLKNAVGKISAENIVAYPPGSPVVTAGEIFSEEAVNLISEYIAAGVEIIGVEHNFVDVVR